MKKIIISSFLLSTLFNHTTFCPVYFEPGSPHGFAIYYEPAKPLKKTSSQKPLPVDSSTAPTQKHQRNNTTINRQIPSKNCC